MAEAQYTTWEDNGKPFYLIPLTTRSRFLFRTERLFAVARATGPGQGTMLRIPAYYFPLKIAREIRDNLNAVVEAAVIGKSS